MGAPGEPARLPIESPSPNWLDRACALCALFGGAVLTSLALMSVASIVGRAVFSRPLQGDYELIQAPSTPQKIVDVFRLYVETQGPPTSLSGWYSRDRTKLPRDGIAGARDGTRIELQFLLDQDSRRRLATFVGAQQGDSLVGSYVGVGGVVVYRRRK